MSIYQVEGRFPLQAYDGKHPEKENYLQGLCRKGSSWLSTWIFFEKKNKENHTFKVTTSEKRKDHFFNSFHLLPES